jgi:indolepyruvate decarboxylase
MTTVAIYLLERLKEIGVDHIFGVPGDFVLGFFNRVLESKVSYVGTCNELNAAYAADGYARIKGIGAFSTTFGVGELSAINGLAGSFAENIPVIAITGAPSTINYKESTLLHHTLGDYKIPLEMFEKVTVNAVILNDPKQAPSQIDEAVYDCLFHKKPIYFAICADVVDAPCTEIKPFSFPPKRKSDPKQLKEALDECVDLIENSKKPIFIADAELIRFGLEKEFASLLEKTGFPYATMMLGKTVLNEDHPQFIGQYQGAKSRTYLKNRVEQSDCIIMLGAILSDLNTGGFSSNVDLSKRICANISKVTVKHHIYDQIFLEDFLNGLAQRLKKRNSSTLEIHPASEGCLHRRSKEFKIDPSKKITHDRFYDRISSFILENSIVLAETGSSMFSASETLMPKDTTFIAQTFYGSIGYTIGATLGAARAAVNRRVILFIGDGSFQVTCQDISTMMRQGLNPIIFLINNDGYTIERVIVDNEYNNIASWKYHLLPSVLGDGIGFKVKTEQELEEALDQALDCSKLCMIEVHMGRFDCSSSLKQAGEAMAKSNKLK